MTTIGFIGLGVAIIFLGFTSETNFEDFTRNDYSKLAFLYLVAFVLCFLFDIVLTLMRIAFEKIIAAVKNIWLCHSYHKRAQKHYHILQAALSDNKSAATLVDLEQFAPSDEDPSKAERYANLIQRIEEQIEAGIAGKEQYWAEVDLLRRRLRELEFKKIEAKMFPTRFDGRIEETENTIHIIRKIISLLDDSIRISKERLEVLGKSSF